MKKTIKIDFIQEGMSEPFSSTNMPIDELPESFDKHTTLTIGDEQWEVQEAIPEKKDIFSKTGFLKLVLKKVELIDPNEILFSTLTINDELPQLEQREVSQNILPMHEDNWRQFELISRKFKKEIEYEFRYIIRVEKEHKVKDAGYNNIHVRKEISTPLDDKSITLQELEEHFQKREFYDDVVLYAISDKESTFKNVIVNNYAFYTANGWVLWGKTNGKGKLLYINIAETEDGNNESFSKEMDAFLEKHELFSVEWCRFAWSGGEYGRFTK